MNNTVFSIFLFILGLIIGFVVVFIVNFLKKKSDNKKADSIIETAKKDADKNDVIFIGGSTFVVADLLQEFA